MPTLRISEAYIIDFKQKIVIFTYKFDLFVIFMNRNKYKTHYQLRYNLMVTLHLVTLLIFVNYF